MPIFVNLLGSLIAVIMLSVKLFLILSNLICKLFINLLLKEITLSAPRTNRSGFWLLTLRDLISANADNGRTNFDGGDIFDITQRVYSEIIGNTDDGTSVNLSFVGTYNPVVDVNGNPEFAPFTSKQQDEIESDLTLLNAYVTKDLNMDHSVTIGRFVTSWGESTFIPIGMNGLTTNAVDLSKLRNPGSSIKEALIPTEQITLEAVSYTHLTLPTKA